MLKFILVQNIILSVLKNKIIILIVKMVKVNIF